MSSIRDLLRECTVRVDIGDQPSGTGFFVTPGTIVTCAHVVEAVLLGSRVETPSLAITDWQQERLSVTLDPRDVWSDEHIDLALLRIDRGLERLSVLLDPDVRERDEVASYGYPRKYAGGVPTSLVVEGEMGAPQ